MTAMFDGMLKNHDILLSEYNRRQTSIKEYKEGGDAESAHDLELYNDGLARAFSLIYGYRTEEAEYITDEYKRRTKIA